MAKASAWFETTVVRMVMSNATEEQVCDKNRCKSIVVDCVYCVICVNDCDFSRIITLV